jgi:hypothetical protein
MRRLIPILLSSILLGVAFGQASGSSVAKVPVITVCEALHDLGRWNGKAIIIVGGFDSTGEGFWLDEDCKDKLVTDGYTWPDAIWIEYISKEPPPPPMPTPLWDDKLLTAKLTLVQETTKLRVFEDHYYDDKWIAMFGRFEARLPPQLRGIGRVGYGFGHLNGAPAQLISVEGAFKEWTRQKNSWVGPGSRKWPIE